jgi:large subunit ribosomal protein L10
LNIETKKEIVADLNERFQRCQVMIVTDYKGLDVAAINDLRRRLREADVEFRVAKNSLLVRASDGNQVGLIKESFKGPSAVILSYDDPVAPARIVSEFAKENEHLEIKAGVMGGRALDAGAIKALAVLPSREALLSQVLSLLVAVPTSFVRTLNAIPQQMCNVLAAIRDQKEQAAT